MKVVGITVVTGDAWLGENVLHCRRLLEILGRGYNVPVVPGAALPIEATIDSVAKWEASNGQVVRLTPSVF